jgi:insecticidal toxin complex protein TccC
LAQIVGATTRSEINRSTPSVTVYSNQGLAVRQLGYYRREIDEAATVRIHLQRYNSAGQLKSSIDPRLSVNYLANSATTIPNQQQQSTLSGAVLKSDNVDAGIRVAFPDVQGKPLWSWDSRGTENSVDYDKLRRVTAVYEKERGKEKVCRERFRYGEASDIGEKNNTVGQLIKHYDTAGLQLIPEYNLLGIATQDERIFLTSEKIADWANDNTENAKLLEELSYASSSETNVLGETLTQIDAANNERHTRYDIAGQVSQTTLQLSGEAEKFLVHHRIYRATGQLQEETLGNGVQLQYFYEADTQRLTEKRATRLLGNKVLQSLHYNYDPVGNVVSIEDKAQEVEYYKNAKAESISHYVYDSLYQLIAADGVESEQASREISRLPHAISFGNKDACRLVNYQKTYNYDAGGNLYAIQHQGAGTYTQELIIDTLSNRGIEKRAAGPTLHESFDANGNYLYLNIDQPLSWDTRNQLQETVQIERSDTIFDKETYVYDGSGMRVQKKRTYLAENQIHTERVRYLSGLELREHWQTNSQGENKQIREKLQLIQAQAGNVPVKVLHWQSGKPDAIENDATYYSLSDHLGSNQIELNKTAEVVSFESYYPYGGTAIWSTRNQIEADYKYQRYSGKERDHSGLYYYGYRYYLPWLGRWLNPDPAGTADGLNLFWMAWNNPVNLVDPDGMGPAPFPLHPAEQRLRDLLPDILTFANNQVSAALEALTQRGILWAKAPIPGNYLKIVEDFMGNASTQTIKNLHKRFESIKAGLKRITPESFSIVYSIAYWEGEEEDEWDTFAWVTSDDINRFQSGYPATIHLSYINLATLHPEAIAATVLHEISHLVLGTGDFEYSIQQAPQKSFYGTTLLLPLLEYAVKRASRPLENADTLSNLSAVLYYVSRKNYVDDIYRPALGYTYDRPSLEYNKLQSSSGVNMSKLEIASSRSGRKFNAEYFPSVDPVDYFNPRLFGT